MSRLEDLRAEVRRLEAEEREEREALRASVTPTYRYEFVRSPHDRTMHPDYAMFRLSRICTNPEAVEAVGGTVRNDGGGWVVDVARGRMVTASAGTFFTPSATFARGQDLDFEAIYAPLMAWLRENPDGGDCTAQVEPLVRKD